MFWFSSRTKLCYGIKSPSLVKLWALFHRPVPQSCDSEVTEVLLWEWAQNYVSDRYTLIALMWGLCKQANKGKKHSVQINPGGDPAVIMNISVNRCSCSESVWLWVTEEINICQPVTLRFICLYTIYQLQNNQYQY